MNKIPTFDELNAMRIKRNNATIAARAIHNSYANYIDQQNQIANAGEKATMLSQPIDLKNILLSDYNENKQTDEGEKTKLLNNITDDKIVNKVYNDLVGKLDNEQLKALNAIWKTKVIKHIKESFTDGIRLDDFATAVIGVIGEYNNKLVKNTHQLNNISGPIKLLEQSLRDAYAFKNRTETIQSYATGVKKTTQTHNLAKVNNLITTLEKIRYDYANSSTKENVIHIDNQLKNYVKANSAFITKIKNDINEPLPVLDDPTKLLDITSTPTPITLYKPPVSSASSNATVNNYVSQPTLKSNKVMNDILNEGSPVLTKKKTQLIKAQLIQ